MSTKQHRFVLVSSCDQKYFPLVKGMYLSVIQSGHFMPDMELAFLDFGCEATALAWLRSAGVRVISLTNSILGELGHSSFGYHRAQICRPFLPKLLPDFDVIAWIDSDAWFQDASILRVLSIEAKKYRTAILVSPEVHYTYAKINERPGDTRDELHLCYDALYGSDVAKEHCILPSVNSGFFVMYADNPLWPQWEAEIVRIYGEKRDSLHPIIRHFGEQISLNYLLRTQAAARYFDPIFNYLCLWTPPFRDRNGVVRIAFPPYTPVGMIHLAGGWKYFGRTYLRRNLLYRDGQYLSDEEAATLNVRIGARNFR